MNELTPPSSRVAGHFTITSDTRGVLAEFTNLITDVGLNNMWASDYVNYCYVGNGNTPPTFLDTALANRTALTNNTTGAATVVNTTSPPYISKMTKTFRFSLGAVTGNISEVGIGWWIGGTPTQYGLFSRALILDELSDPTTLTILNTEVLDVTYTLFLYIPVEDTTGTLVMDGNAGGATHTWVMRASRVTDPLLWRAGQKMNTLASKVNNAYPYISRVVAFDSPIVAITSAPSGFTRGCDTPNNVPGATWSIATGNVTARSLHITAFPGAEYQVEFTPPIVKTIDQTLAITYTHTWDRWVAPI
jgi:hypothetical protein